jgi:hypothetical protein
MLRETATVQQRSCSFRPPAIERSSNFKPRQRCRSRDVCGVTKHKMMRSVRASDGFNQARIAFAFSPALRSSDIFALALRSSSLVHLPSVLTKVIVAPKISHDHPRVSLGEDDCKHFRV